MLGDIAQKVDDSKKRLAFELKMIDDLIVLSAPTDEARGKWMGTLTHRKENVF